MGSGSLVDRFERGDSQSFTTLDLLCIQVEQRHLLEGELDMTTSSHGSESVEELC